MSDQGYGADEAEAKALEAHAKFKAAQEYEAYQQKYPAAQEANAASSAGQLFRPGAKKAGVQEANTLVLLSSLREAGAPNNATREVPVTIIREGMGNKRDRHVYTRAALQEAAPKFSGEKCYADHPSKFEEANRPERSIKEIVGYYRDTHYVEEAGVGKIKGVLKINQGKAYDWAWDMLLEAIDFAKKFPEKDYIGISINAQGSTHEEQGPDGAPANFVDMIEAIVSADLVTQAGAGGKIDGLKEAVALLESARGTGGTHMKKALEAVAAVLAEARKKMKEEDAADKKYGGALDQVMEELKKIVAAHGTKEEGEAAAVCPHCGKALMGEEEGGSAGAHAEPDGDESPAGKMGEEDEMKAAEKKYREGKLTPSEKMLFEAAVAAQAKASLIESKALMEKKISESGLPAKAVEDLRLTLIGKSAKEMDTLIAARKSLMEAVFENRGTGAGAGAGHEPASKLKESLAGAGVPLKK